MLLENYVSTVAIYKCYKTSHQSCFENVLSKNIYLGSETFDLTAEEALSSFQLEHTILALKYLNPFHKQAFSVIFSTNKMGAIFLLPSKSSITQRMSFHFVGGSYFGNKNLGFCTCRPKQKSSGC